MSVLETLRAEEAKLAKKHEALSAECNTARQARKDADGKLQKAKAAAGDVWNELAGIRASLRELEKRQKPAVTGAGDLKAEGAK